MNIEQQQKEYIFDTCTVCGCREHASLFNIAPRKIVECTNCGHEYVYLYTTKPKYFFPPSEEDSLSTKIDLIYLNKIFRKYKLFGKKLLDLGCGEGRLEKGLIDSGWDQENLYLMENSQSSIEIVKKKYPAANHILGNAEEELGLEEYFDCILMVEFLEDIVNPRLALNNAIKALKENGHLIIRAMPNNKSFESFLGEEKWKMRLFQHHHHFFNPEIFSRFVSEFTNIKILEFGCFLQKGFHFYNIERIAKNIGITKGIKNKNKNDNSSTQNDNLTALIIEKMNRTNIDEYPYKKQILKSHFAQLSSTKEVENFFNLIHLDFRLSPDFSVVIRKNSRI